MHRRKFIKNLALGTAATIAAPWILPSGRLFAATGRRRVNHVVLCLFAGGVRNIESMKMEEGNLMPFTLKGDQSIAREILPGMSPLPQASGKRLSEYGTLFREFRFKDGPTAHVSAHLAAISGQYIINGLNTKERPPFPTIFEYYRKHTDPAKNALNAWWVADRSDPFRVFNFSQHQRYGAPYGANYIQPATILSARNQLALGNPKNYNSEENQVINQLRSFSDKMFLNQFKAGDAGVFNPPTDRQKIWNFIQDSLDSAKRGALDDPWGIGREVMNDDLYQLFFAGEIMKAFHPELLVVNLMAIDLGHTDFTLYCNNIRRADYGLSKLWETIQSDPVLKDDTILIAVPEHGRNLKPNTLKDAYGRLAVDHTSDKTSREIFCLVLGPPDKIKQGQVINREIGESIDVVPTIADALGFWEDIPLRLKGNPLDAAFL